MRFLALGIALNTKGWVLRSRAGADGQRQRPESVGVAGFIARGSDAHPSARAGDPLRLAQIVAQLLIGGDFDQPILEYGQQISWP